MQRICTALAEVGYDVLLVGREMPHSVDLENRPYRQKRLNLLFKKSFLFYSEYNIRIFFLLLFSSFDIVCSIDLDSILPGFLVSRLKSKVFVHDAHELFSEMPELEENKIAKSFWTKTEQFIFPKMKFAYTESEGYQQVYHQKYPETKFEVIRNVPFYYSANRTADQGDYILYQGALNVGRGLEQAVEAMKEIEGELWLAGEGDVSEKLRNLVSQFGLEKRVRFLGWVKPNDLRAITQNAQIGLNLLEPSNRHYQLSFPNKLFDYIMAELPQISMDFPYYQQIIQDKSIGIFIPDLSVENVVKALARLKTDQDFYEKCIEHCKALKEIHNWENEKKKLVKFYQKMPV